MPHADPNATGRSRRRTARVPNSMQAIAEHFGVIRMTVSRTVKRDENGAGVRDIACET